ncbi:MAG: DUF6279 family lipoprotein [Burkholderiaceae bacterium]
MSVFFRLKVWIIAACLTLLAGCSALRLAYNQAPDLMYWWLDGYFDFNDQQTPLVRASVADWLAWHRGDQLPEYAALLARAQQDVAGQATAEQACRWWGELRQRAAIAFDHGVPALADLVRTLKPEQVAHVERRYQKGDDDFRGDFLQASRADRLEASIKRTVSRAELLYGRLDDAQRAQVAQAMAASPFDAQAWFAERQERQREIVQTLRGLVADAADAGRTQAALRVFAAHAATSPRPAYRAYLQQLTDYNCRFAAQLHNSTSPEQRRRAVEKLKGWEDDVRALSAQRP